MVLYIIGVTVGSILYAMFEHRLYKLEFLLVPFRWLGSLLSLRWVNPDRKIAARLCPKCYHPMIEGKMGGHHCYKCDLPFHTFLDNGINSVENKIEARVIKKTTKEIGENDKILVKSYIQDTHSVYLSDRQVDDFIKSNHIFSCDPKIDGPHLSYCLLKWLGIYVQHDLMFWPGSMGGCFSTNEYFQKFGKKLIEVAHKKNVVIGGEWYSDSIWCYQKYSKDKIEAYRIELVKGVAKKYDIWLTDEQAKTYLRHYDPRTCSMDFWVFSTVRWLDNEAETEDLMMNIKLRLDTRQPKVKEQLIRRGIKLGDSWKSDYEMIKSL
jgi:hypothetical protein